MMSLTVRGRTNQMARGESPAVARRRLRLALRHAREVNGFTQGQVAAALDWSLSKVQRIESGDVTVSRTDLTALLNHLGVNDLNQINDLVAAARTSRRKGWWDDPKFRLHLTPATMQLLQFESEATAIRVFHPTLLPGLLQTPAYAQAIFQFWRDDLSDEDRSVRFEVRMQRRDYVFSSAAPPDYLLLLDESVMFREVGGPQVMAEQLYQLLALMRSGSIMARVIPLDRSAPIAMLSHFIILDFGADENAVLYHEAQLGDVIVQAPAEIKTFRNCFERMWDEALSPNATERLIEARISVLVGSDRERFGANPRQS